jgi:hypothetical protein
MVVVMVAVVVLAAAVVVVVAVVAVMVATVVVVAALVMVATVVVVALVVLSSSYIYLHYLPPFLERRVDTGYLFVFSAHQLKCTAVRVNRISPSRVPRVPVLAGDKTICDMQYGMWHAYRWCRRLDMRSCSVSRTQGVHRAQGVENRCGARQMFGCQ